MKFKGTRYTDVAAEDLMIAVNAAITLGNSPLLIEGESGTGKTVLAQEVA